jgi:hypothetical protein
VKRERMQIIALNVRRMIMILLILVIVGVTVGNPSSGGVQARTLASSGPDRHAVITIDYTTYEWWLLSWQNSQVICQIYVEHEGWPDSSEVQYYCSASVFNQWLKTQPCVFNQTVTWTHQMFSYPSVNVIRSRLRTDAAHCLACILKDLSRYQTK